MRIHLIRPHTHAGRKYPIGAELDLADHKAAWLIALGVAQAADAAAPASNPAATEKPATRKEKTQ